MARGQRVVCYDLLGYGASERPTARDIPVTAQTDLLVALLDTLRLDQVHLIGHDIGGAIVQRLAVWRPDRLRRVVLADTVSYDSWPSPTWRRIIDDHLERYEALLLPEFQALLTHQLQMTVVDPARMASEVLDA